MKYFIYVSSICIANLLVFKFGPVMSIVNSFVLIGLDLTLRDRIHDEIGIYGAIAMSFLAGALSYLLNPAGGMIAIASVVAFVSAAAADGIVYHIASRNGWMYRANMSNAAGASVDSMVFPAVAFGEFMPLIIIGQFASKVIGGAIWSLLLRGGR